MYVTVILIFDASYKLKFVPAAAALWYYYILHTAQTMASIGELKKLSLSC